MNLALPKPLSLRAQLSLPGAVAAARNCCDQHCFGYHATWRVFRHAGLKGHPGWHAGFYATALAGHRLPTNRPIRTLICAASDESMLAVLADLLPAHRLAVTLVDACRTPLMLAAAYAQRHRINLTICHASVQQMPNFDEPFDLIVTDGLLSLLPTPADATALLARLAGALHHDGILLYTTRIAGSGGVLEYDRLGRLGQAATTKLFWPGPSAERRELAAQIRRRPARANPFPDPAAVRAAFIPHFAGVRLFIRTAPHTLALRLHPAVHRHDGSRSVGVTATHARRTP